MAQTQAQTVEMVLPQPSTTALTDNDAGRSTIKISDIKYGDRFRKDFGNISELVESIKINGLLCPIGVTKDGLLVHGARRVKAYVQALPDVDHIPCCVIDIPIKENGEIDENLIRKCFSAEELLVIKKYRESIESNLQGKRSDLVQPMGKFPRSSERREERIAKGTGYSYKTLAKLEQIAKASEASPQSFGDILNKIDKGMKINKAWKLVQNHKKRADLAQSVKIALTHKKNIRLILGDSKERLTELSDGSVHLIFTDPPYADRNLHLYELLALQGYRLLKANGSLVTYAGHYAVPQIIQYMHKQNLQYYWIFAVIHSGPFSSFFAKNILVKWKPLLWFVKGEKPYQNGKIFDLIDSNKAEKILHDHQQSSEDARYIIEQLTKPGEVVCDPFMGSGTTGIAAQKLGRQFIGIEISRENYEAANLNIASTSKSREGSCNE